ncbi:hypothetical protein ACIQMJ_26505 [Actinosynnema sp. NPDC091369]
MAEERSPGPGIGQRVGGVVMMAVGVGLLVYAAFTAAGEIRIENGAGEPVQHILWIRLLCALLALGFAGTAVAAGVEIFTGRSESSGGGGTSSRQSGVWIDPGD